MKNRKVSFLLLVSMLLIQRLLYQTTDLELYQFPFASSLRIFDGQTSNILMILYVLIPIPYVLFEFSGKVKGLLEGYGKLFVIRSYKREWLYLKTIGKCALELIVIIGVQTLMFLWGRQKWEEISALQAGLVLAAYWLGLFLLVMLQMCLEFFMDSNYANLIINIFFVLSLFIGTGTMRSERLYGIGILFFPNLFFGTRNGAIQQGDIDVNYEFALTYLVMASVIVCVFSIQKFRKKDIF
ncbi:DUF2705 family protein [Sellimonas sp.]|uniref:DUF2705 family protein n=1 Tax=Sellimonas sp. TaxID=2021466 RepID=UPI000B36687C|nr:DUF2705 family protein [Sellimonas sp.]OUP01256.1 hypothetical protein B5F37_08055 [Drancourtella sp. An210]